MIYYFLDAREGGAARRKERSEMEIKAPRGTVDITPEESGRWIYVEGRIRSVMGRFGYREMRTPLFESTELFARGVGEGTDIVNKEMYTFTDKGGRSLTLRPEGTAPVARAFIEHGMYGQEKATKVYYIGPMFRYERPQAGRFRQHYQFGAECLGAPGPLADVEIVALAMEIYRGLGLKELSLILNSIGCPECRPAYLAKLKEWLRGVEGELCEDCRTRMEKNALRVLDCKQEHCRKATEGAPASHEHLCAACAEHFAAVRGHMERLGIRYTLDARLVRGLDYYTRTTFEIVSGKIGAQSAVAGGGRYDGLIETLGGKATPGVGFGAGLERLLMVLEQEGVELATGQGPLVYFALLGAAAVEKGLGLAQAARAAGVRCETDLFGKGLKGQLKTAGRIDATHVVIVGEDELAKGRCVLRDFKTGEQQEIELEKIVETLCGLGA